jgi:hypothetical protein
VISLLFVPLFLAFERGALLDVPKSRTGFRAGSTSARKIRDSGAFG